MLGTRIAPVASNCGDCTMSEERTRMRSQSGQTVVCALCGESLPRDHSIVTEAYGRICHFCFKEEEAGLHHDDWDDDWDDDGDDDDW
jgi:hypothetical protein